MGKLMFEANNQIGSEDIALRVLSSPVGRVRERVGNQFWVPVQCWGPDNEHVGQVCSWIRVIRFLLEKCCWELSPPNHSNASLHIYS